MADSRRRVEWRQTASILAMLANLHRDPKRRSRPYEIDDFDPMRDDREPSIDHGIEVLRQFVRPNPGAR
jgi:hypothetical protein